MDASPPLALVLAASPEAAGAAAVVARAAAEAAGGRPVRVLLAGAGLVWAGDARLPAGSDVAVCSRNAREAGWTAQTTPEGVRWSSVATWMAELGAAGGGSLWTVLP